MAYARFGEGDSDVYVFQDMDGDFHVYHEESSKHLDAQFDSASATLRHLKKCMEDGCQVPQHCIDRLTYESEGGKQLGGPE